MASGNALNARLDTLGMDATVWHAVIIFPTANDAITMEDV